MSRTLTFAGGQSGQKFTVPLPDDGVCGEPDEMILLILYNFAGGVPAPRRGC